MQKKLGLIQVYRGLAAACVVLYHVNVSTDFYYKVPWVSNFFSFGWVGVDCFFVLSGFIMMFIHYKDILNRKNIKSFFIKRFIRIYPIYWIIASISLFFQMYTGKLSFGNDWEFILKSYLLIPQASYPFLFPAWSLIYECFFYLVFGLSIFFGFKISKYLWIGWLALIIVFQIWPNNFSQLLMFNPLILEFIMGCIIGYVFHKYFDSVKKYAGLLLNSGVFLFILVLGLGALFLNLPERHSLAGCFLFGSLSACIVLGAALKDSIKEVKLPAILLLLGEASYTIYLSHQILIGLVYKTVYSRFPALHSNSLTFVGIIAAALALLFGVILHELVEKRVLDKLQKTFVRGKKSLVMTSS